MFAVLGAEDVAVDADLVKCGDDVFYLGECFKGVVDDDGKGDVVLEGVSACGDDGLVRGCGEGAVAGELLFFFVHLFFPVAFRFGWVGASAADDARGEGGVFSLAEAGDAAHASSFADRGDGVPEAGEFVGAVGLSLVGMGDFEGFLDDVWAVGGGEDLGEGDLFFHRAVDAVDVDLRHGLHSLFAAD